jgi:mTERF domain-containing protein
MLRLRSTILSRLLCPPTASCGSSLHRLLSADAPLNPPNPSFAVEEYLVATCGLTRAQALKASAKLSHLKSPTKPDAVLAFLGGLGLSGADLAALVAKDPQLLCASVERTLAPVLARLTGHGLSHTEITRFVSLRSSIFRCRSAVSNLPYYLSLIDSTENLVRFLKRSSSLLGHSLEKVIKPNVALLRECGLADCDISKMCFSSPALLGTNPQRLQATVWCAEGLGVPRGSVMFRYALEAVGFLGEEKIADKVDYLKNMFRWSDADVRIVVSKYPLILTRSKENLQSKSKFLISEVGLEPAYIAHWPQYLSCSLEGRLRPRYYAVKYLKENGFLRRDRSYLSAVTVTEKVFMERYISPHSEAAPHLAEDYANACRGEVPARFIFA